MQSDTNIRTYPVEIYTARAIVHRVNPIYQMLWEARQLTIGSRYLDRRVGSLAI